MALVKSVSAEVGIEVGELLGHEHPLVHDRARREADDIEAAARADRVLRLTADDVQLALERLLVGAAATGDEHLPEDGGRRARDRPHLIEVRGHVAPAEDVLSFLLDDVLEDELARTALPGVGWEEDHADGVTAGPRELEAELCHLAPEELVRQLDDEAGPVAAAGIASDRAAMRHVRQQRQALAYDLVRCRAADVGDESHAARVALVAQRIVQPFLLRQSVVHVSGAPTCGRPTKKPLLTAGQEGPLHHSVPACS